MTLPSKWSLSLQLCFRAVAVLCLGQLKPFPGNVKDRSIVDASFVRKDVVRLDEPSVPPVSTHVGEEHREEEEDEGRDHDRGEHQGCPDDAGLSRELEPRAGAADGVA